MNVILQTPPEHAPAYNPLILVIQAPYYRLQELEKELGNYPPDSPEYDAISDQINAIQQYAQQKTLDPITVHTTNGSTILSSVTINRTPDSDGKATFDLSYIIRTAFRNVKQQVGQSGYFYDYNLYCTYNIIDQDDPQSQPLFVGKAYNAVQQYDTFTNAGMGDSRVLTETMRTYEGYPFEVSLYAGAQSFKISTYPNPNQASNVPVGSTIFDFSGVTRYNTTINGQTTENIPVPQGCVPDRPFYVRWVNQQGGYNYWMFRMQTDAETTNEYENIIVKRSSIADEQRTIFANAAHTVATSADLLTEDEFNILKGIAYSPRIQWYNETMGQWVTITIAEDVTTSNRMWSGFYSVAYTFNLPQILTQF